MGRLAILAAFIAVGSTGRVRSARVCAPAPLTRTCGPCGQNTQALVSSIDGLPAPPVTRDRAPAAPRLGGTTNGIGGGLCDSALVCHGACGRRILAREPHTCSSLLGADPTRCPCLLPNPTLSSAGSRCRCAEVGLSTASTRPARKRRAWARVRGRCNSARRHWWPASPRATCSTT